MKSQKKTTKDNKIENPANELPGSLESKAPEKGFNDLVLEEFVNDINSMPGKNRFKILF